MPCRPPMGQAVVMAITLPLPVRVAAGILATGIDAVRSLPTEIPALPVALVGNALKLSMKVQQEIASLATRGDELLGGVVGAPQENPSWARFDDDDPPAPRPTVVRPPAAGPTTETSAPEHTLSTPEASAMPPGTTTAIQAALEVPEAVVELALVATDDDDETTPPGDPDFPEFPAVDNSAERPLAALIAEEPLVPDIDDQPLADDVAEAALAAEISEEVASEVAAEILAEQVAEAVAAEILAEQVAEEVAAEILAEEIAEDIAEEVAAEILAGQVAEVVEADAASERAAIELAEEILAEEIAEEKAEELAEELLTGSIADEPAPQSGPAGDAAAGTAGPAVLPGYEEMTLAQVRGHLRELSADDVTVLLDYERSGGNRAPFLTLLSNRLVTLDAQQP